MDVDIYEVPFEEDDATPRVTPRSRSRSRSGSLPTTRQYTGEDDDSSSGDSDSESVSASGSDSDISDEDREQAHLWKERTGQARRNMKNDRWRDSRGLDYSNISTRVMQKSEAVPKDLQADARHAQLEVPSQSRTHTNAL
jgi:hypothetical protein